MNKEEFIEDLQKSEIRIHDSLNKRLIDMEARICGRIRNVVMDLRDIKSMVSKHEEIEKHLSTSRWVKEVCQLRMFISVSLRSISSRQTT